MAFILHIAVQGDIETSTKSRMELKPSGLEDNKLA